MSRLRSSRPLCRVLCVLVSVAIAAVYAPAPILAQPGNPPPPEPQETQEEVDDLLRRGLYDRAVNVLRPEIEGRRAQYDERVHLPVGERLTPEQESELAKVYLDLILVYVSWANEEPSRDTKRLRTGEGLKLVKDFVTTPEFRDASPRPTDPPEMSDLFEQARDEVFGSLEIKPLDPPDATVVLAPLDQMSSFDADTLQAVSVDSTIQRNHILAGNYSIWVVRDGYRQLNETIAIEPGKDLKRPYTLRKGRTTRWWVTRGVVVAGVATAIALLVRNPPDETTEVPPLPGPPPPPGN